MARPASAERRRRKKVLPDHISVDSDSPERFQDPCHRDDRATARARLLHIRRSSRLACPERRLKRLRWTKHRFQTRNHAARCLIAYKTFADLAGKGSLFVITIVAARRLSPESFGVFSLGSTLGWIVAVVTDLRDSAAPGARGRAPAGARRRRCCAAWLRVRLWTAGRRDGARGARSRRRRVERGRLPAPIAILAVVYACSGLIELLHYFYRGLSRSESSRRSRCGSVADTLAFGAARARVETGRRRCSRLRCWFRSPSRWRSACASRSARARGGSVRSDARSARAVRSERRQSADRRRSARGTVFRRDVWPIGAGIVLSALYFRIDVLPGASSGRAPKRSRSTTRCSGWSRRCGCFPAAVLAGRCCRRWCRAGDLRPLTRVTRADHRLRARASARSCCGRRPVG